MTDDLAIELLKELRGVQLQVKRLTTMEPESLRGPAAAAFLGISLSKLKELRQQGRVAFTSIDGCVSYPVDGLRAFREANTFRP